MDYPFENDSFGAPQKPLTEKDSAPEAEVIETTEMPEQQPTYQPQEPTYQPPQQTYQPQQAAPVYAAPPAYQPQPQMPAAQAPSVDVYDEDIPF